MKHAFHTAHFVKNVFTFCCKCVIISCVLLFYYMSVIVI